MSVVIIDYGSGNLHSAHKAFERAVQEQGGGLRVEVSADPDVIAKADRIVLPGVGAFADCRAGLDAVSGLHEALEEAVIRKGRPFLGICVGMQLMAARGLEHTTSTGLGWIKGDVERITPTDPSLKIPHMGWNELELKRPHALFDGIPTGPAGWNAYFVHSYHLKASDAHDVIATTEYGGTITAMVGRDNMVGTQFHPEKSQRLGLALIGNFLRWVP
jgi:glutamine amidotransferase